VVLPSFLNEQDDQYQVLADNPKVFIYESYHESVGRKLVERSVKENEMFKKKKMQQRPRYLFAIDDCTSQGGEVMKSEFVKRIATESRHLNIHAWFCIHHSKNTIPPAVRLQAKFIFAYNMQLASLKMVFTDFVNFTEFRKFNDFLSFWDEYVVPREHGCLLIVRNESYSPEVNEWFEKQNIFSGNNIEKNNEKENRPREEKAIQRKVSSKKEIGLI
jgi:hypothetical protein